MTDKTQPTAHAEITAPISADLRRIDDAGAKSAPITLMTEDRACKWAWDQVREDVGTKGWTAGDSCNFYGFFLWGWHYRGQYETQRPAAPPAPAAVAVLAASEVLDALNYVDDFIARCNGDDRCSCASVNLLRAALAAAPAQAVAVPELDMDRVLSIADVHAEESREDGTRLLDRGGLVAFAKDVLRVAAPAQEHATQVAGQAPAAPVAHPHHCTARSADGACEECEGHAQAMAEWRAEAAAPAQAQEDARNLETEALRACRDLPEGWEIEIHLERGYGVVTVIDPQGNDDELPVEGTLFDALKETIDTAIRDDAARAAQGGA